MSNKNNKEEEEINWLFPEFFKASVMKDKDITLVERGLFAMGGLGLMIIEPFGKVGSKLFGSD